MCPCLPFSFSSDNTKSIFIPWKLGLSKESKYQFGVSVNFCYWYLWPLIALLDPDFNCCNSFALSWVERVTAGTLRFAIVIASVIALFASKITQFSDQLKSRVT